jgi:hypothetical protein
MDREQFDAFARLVWTTASRRAALGALVGAVVLGGAFNPAVAKPRSKDKKQGKRKRKKGNKGKKRPCYPGTNCQLGPGNDNSGCDFTESVRFFALDVQGANLSQANLTEAQLAGADLRGVDLSGACLVGANLLNATIDDETNFDDAILCRTLMPNGEIDDSGCDEGTRCCPAPEECEDQPCVGCTNRFNDECSVIGFPAAFCCEPMICTPTLVSPFYTRCQVPCTSDAICQNVFGGNSHCAVDLFFCPYIGPCCSKP